MVHGVGISSGQCPDDVPLEVACLTGCGVGTGWGSGGDWARWRPGDQSYLTGPNNPTMVTPAFLPMIQAQQTSPSARGAAAIAFILFTFIVLLTIVQRKFVKEDLTTK